VKQNEKKTEEIREKDLLKEYLEQTEKEGKHQYSEMLHNDYSDSCCLCDLCECLTCFSC
jgi:hypothetical protein